jgi:hypothetical protein
MINKRSEKVRVKKNKPTTNIFSHLLNAAAFVDTITLNVDGELSKTYEKELSSSKNIGILNPNALFSRCVFATWPVTGNPITITYGKAKHFKTLPRLLIKLRSENVPLTGAQVQLLINRLTNSSPDVTVSSLELTFDVTGVELQWVRNNLLHRAKRIRILKDTTGRQTIYVGSAKSSWQARIYQKTETILRLEFILRRPFLKDHNINRPEDIVLLRKLNIWRLLSLRRFSRSHAIQVTKHWANPVAKNILIDWARWNRSREGLVRMLRINRVDFKRILRKTRLQRTLEHMQHQLIW